MEEKKAIDLSNYPEGAQEVIKYMDWLETDEERLASLITFLGFALGS